MKRTLLLLALFSATPALADGRGQATFSTKCARCHVVGQGQPVADKQKFSDITLATRQHDDRWLVAFLQKPWEVDPKTACSARIDAEAARHVVHFLKDRLRPVSPTATGAPNHSGPQAGVIPPALPMKVAPAPAPPKPQGMVRR